MILLKKNNVNYVRKVVIESGEVSTIVPKYLYDVWPWACKRRSKYMKDCEQLYDTIPSGKI